MHNLLSLLFFPSDFSHVSAFRLLSFSQYFLSFSCLCLSVFNAFAMYNVRLSFCLVCHLFNFLSFSFMGICRVFMASLVCFCVFSFVFYLILDHTLVPVYLCVFFLLCFYSNFRRFLIFSFFSLFSSYSILFFPLNTYRVFSRFISYAFFFRFL